MPETGTGGVRAMPNPRGVRSIYIHAPFCRRRCPFCDYAVTVLPQPEDTAEAGTQVASPAPRPLTSWLDAVGKEWAGVLARKSVEVQPLRTLYVGGGTPSVLGPAAMAGVRAMLGETLLGSRNLEWTAEANPEDVDVRLARSWRESGVNRLSMGVQSFQEAALQWLGRLHTAPGSTRSVAIARAAGFENINIDLAFGLPEAVGHDWPADLDRAIALRPAHVTLQEISVEPDTPLGMRVERGEEVMAANEWRRKAYLLASRMLVAAGYTHYEVSSFALPGHESRHGWVYLSGAPWLGLGNAAHSWVEPRRRWNLADWGGYCTAAANDTLSGESLVAGEEALSAEQVRLEALWLGLRTRLGISRDALPAPAAAIADRWIRDGLAVDVPARDVTGHGGEPSARNLYARDGTGRIEPDTVEPGEVVPSDVLPVDVVPGDVVPGDTGSGAVRLTAEGWLRLDHLVVEIDGAFPPDFPDTFRSIRTLHE